MQLQLNSPTPAQLELAAEAQKLAHDLASLVTKAGAHGIAAKWLDVGAAQIGEGLHLLAAGLQGHAADLEVQP